MGHVFAHPSSARLTAQPGAGVMGPRFRRGSSQRGRSIPLPRRPAARRHAGSVRPMPRRAWRGVRSPTHGRGDRSIAGSCEGEAAARSIVPKPGSRMACRGRMVRPRSNGGAKCQPSILARACSTTLGSGCVICHTCATALEDVIVTRIPTAIDEVDASWMSATFGRSITDVHHEQIGIGIGVSSALYRTSLSGFDAPTLITKLPALAEEAVFTSSVLRMYIREVRFFQNLAQDSPVRVPQGYHGVVDEETSQFIQLMEDMGSLRGRRPERGHGNRRRTTSRRRACALAR